MSVLCH